MTARMLALVSDCYGMGGGIARYNQDLVEGLAEGGAQDPRAAAPWPDRRHHVAGRHPPGSAGAQPALVLAEVAVDRMVQGPFDVVFCGHVYMAPIAWAVARLIRCALLAADPWHGRLGAAARAAAGRDRGPAQLVTAVSRGTRHILLGWVDSPPDRVPRDSRHRAGQVRAGAAVRGVAANGPALGPGPILLTVGRLSAGERYKGHEQVFGALPALRAKYPTLVYAVAGGGDDRACLEQRARDLAGDAAVRFLGFVPEEDLLGLYHLADLYVMPSTQEGFGVVILEAAACGLRVVGGVGGGSADAVPDGRVGVLVDPSDQAALVTAIAGQLARGKADLAAVEPYRRTHFAAAAREHRRLALWTKGVV